MKFKALPKIIMLTKLSLAGILSLCLAGIPLYASNTTQVIKSVKESYVSLDLKNASLFELFESVEQQTSYNFTFSKEDINRNYTITRQGARINLGDLLLQVSKESDLIFKQVNLNIGVSKAGSHNKRQVESLQVIIQSRSISGRVTNHEDGEALIGVNIVEMGTTNGTITDIDGRYALTVAEGATLMFSSVGYVSEEVKVDNRSVINMTMTPDIKALEEIVVVGYGTMKESDITGSLASVSSKDFEKQPLTRIDQALQGRATGVQVVQTGGDPGGEFKIRIRGANSITGGNDPMYVVDGMIVNNISNININDIESMEILKDASATAIYGSMGANGVVLITTKAGERGATEFVFDTHHGFANVIRELDMMTPAQYAEAANFIEGEGNELFSQEEIEDLRVNGGTDWQDLVFKQARSSNYQLSMSGGSDAVDFYLSGNYFKTDGTVVGQDYGRYTVRGKVNAKLSEKVKLGFNASGSRAERTGVKAKLDNALTWDPTSAVYNENGELNPTTEKPGVGVTALNPLLQPTHKISDDISNEVTANGYLNMKLVEGLTLDISGGVDWVNAGVSQYEPIQVSINRNARIVTRNNTRLQNTNRLTYIYDKHADHSLQIDAIHEQQAMLRSSQTTISEGFSSDQTTYKNLSLAATHRAMNESSNANLQSFLGRVNYSYLDRYLLTATMRADGASKFRKGNRWGYFPSASLGWRISEENFFQGIKAVNDLKLRVSYGITGNQGIGPMATRDNPASGKPNGYPFGGNELTIGVAPSNRLANPDLTWEETAQGNIGLNVGLWDSKITITADAYKKHTYDLLLTRQLPQIVGPTTMVQNVGEVENKGFEFSINYTPIRKKDLSVTSGFYFNRNLNKVLALVDDLDYMESLAGLYLEGQPVDATWVKVGAPISSFRGYIFEGVYQLGEEAEAQKYNRELGDAKYKDVNGDDQLNTDDIVKVGSGNPDFTFGWNTTAYWKNFDLNFLFTGSVGNDIYNFQRARMMGLGGGIYHASHADFANRWTPENPSNIPADRDDTYGLSTQFLEDGSHVALKNISLSYTFNNNAFNTLGVQGLRLYASIENALIITKYTGFDPETTATGDSDVDLGIDLDTYPLARTITMGVKLTF